MAVIASDIPDLGAFGLTAQVLKSYAKGKSSGV